MYIYVTDIAFILCNMQVQEDDETPTVPTASVLSSEVLQNENLMHTIFQQFPRTSESIDMLEMARSIHQVWNKEVSGMIGPSESRTHAGKWAQEYNNAADEFMEILPDIIVDVDEDDRWEKIASGLTTFRHCTAVLIATLDQLAMHCQTFADDGEQHLEIWQSLKDVIQGLIWEHYSGGHALCERVVVSCLKFFVECSNPTAWRNPMLMDERLLASLVLLFIKEFPDNRDVQLHGTIMIGRLLEEMSDIYDQFEEPSQVVDALYSAVRLHGLFGTHSPNNHNMQISQCVFHAMSSSLRCMWNGVRCNVSTVYAHHIVASGVIDCVMGHFSANGANVMGLPPLHATCIGLLRDIASFDETNCRHIAEFGQHESGGTIELIYRSATQNNGEACKYMFELFALLAAQHKEVISRVLHWHRVQHILRGREYENNLFGVFGDKSIVYNCINTLLVPAGDTDEDCADPVHDREMKIPLAIVTNALHSMRRVCDRLVHHGSWRDEDSNVRPVQADDLEEIVQVFTLLRHATHRSPRERQLMMSNNCVPMTCHIMTRCLSAWDPHEKLHNDGWHILTGLRAATLCYQDNCLALVQRALEEMRFVASIPEQTNKQMYGERLQQVFKVLHDLSTQSTVKRTMLVGDFMPLVFQLIHRYAKDPIVQTQGWYVIAGLWGEPLGPYFPGVGAGVRSGVGERLRILSSCLHAHQRTPDVLAAGCLALASVSNQHYSAALRNEEDSRSVSSSGQSLSFEDSSSSDEDEDLGFPILTLHEHVWEFMSNFPLHAELTINGLRALKRLTPPPIDNGNINAPRNWDPVYTHYTYQAIHQALQTLPTNVEVCKHACALFAHVVSHDPNCDDPLQVKQLVTKTLGGYS